MKLSTVITTIILSTFILMLLSCGNPITTEDPETVTDIDGNVYTTVKIGNQWWTVENLRTTKYNDGSTIPNLTDNTAWANNASGAYCYYNNTTNADTIKKWGALYNWYVVNPANSKKIAPAGWHVSDTTDWNTLQGYLMANGYNWDGTTTGNKIAKSLAAKADWHTDTTNGAIGNDLTQNNRSGFSALPGGIRYYDGAFSFVGYYGYWWSATEQSAEFAWNRSLGYDYYGLSWGSNHKGCGFSVRLVKD